MPALEYFIVVKSELVPEVPATMTLLGDWNWWMPRILDWIPRVTIEGDPDEPEEATGAIEAGATA